MKEFLGKTPRLLFRLVQVLLAVPFAALLTFTLPLWVICYVFYPTSLEKLQEPIFKLMDKVYPE